MRGWIALCLLAPMLSGCLSFLDDDDGTDRDVSPASDVDDASQIRITGVQKHGSLEAPLTVNGRDGTALSVIAYEPLTQDANPDGSAPSFPTVVFVHGFGLTKEMWTCLPMGEPAPPAGPDEPCPFQDMLQTFAEAGFIAVAYDTRGFGRSGGSVTVVGPDELSDLDAIIDWAADQYPANGKVGVTGISYGGGHALMALTTNPKVTTAVSHQGWFDLYEGIAPGNTPKLEWSALLLAEGSATGRMHPMVYDWLTAAAQRTNVQEVEGQMDVRSPADLLAMNQKPLLACHGMQETLFPHAQLLWEGHGGFTRAIVHEGGHGHIDPYCWDRTLDWFSFFLRGIDTQVDTWPALETIDASGGNLVSFDPFPEATIEAYYLRDPQLTSYSGSNATFTVSQQVANNPVQEPSAVWDQTGQTNQAIPYQMRNDPSATFFEAAPLENSAVLIGSPRLTLEVAAGFENQPWQATAQLIHIGEDGSRILSRGAYTHVPGTTVDINGTAVIDFHYTKAEMAPGDVLVLKVGGNDMSWFMQYPGNYSVDFTGHSMLEVPFF